MFSFSVKRRAYYSLQNNLYDGVGQGEIYIKKTIELKSFVAVIKELQVFVVMVAQMADCSIYILLTKTITFWVFLFFLWPYTMLSYLVKV